MTEYVLELKNINKYFGKNHVIKNVSMNFKKGDFVTFLGPSGCGKTTILRMIAGFYEPDDGEILLNKRNIERVPPYARNAAMVFQEYALFPHMNVYENVSYGLSVKGMGKAEMDEKVKKALTLMQLQGMEARYPNQMSGGQQQRVAVARALVMDPEILLLDEPLSNLDAKLRESVRVELRDIQRQMNLSTIYVTHDQIEAMTVGQRVAIMYRGNMEMLDTPSHVYNMPASIFCARFIGSPSMNIISCQYENGNLSIGDQMIRLAPMWRPIADACPSGKYCVGIRPEHIVLSSRPTETSICGTVKYVEDYGNRYGVYIDVKGEKSELIAICNDSVPRPGENIFMNIDFRKLHLFDAQSEKSLGYPEEIRRLNAALDFSMPDAQNKNQKTGGKYHESFGQYQCV